MTTSMSLDQLLAGVMAPVNAGDIMVSGLTLDSRHVRPGDAFVALRGTREHGIGHAASAVANGAVAILAESFDGASRVTRRSCGSPFGPSTAPMFAPASCLRSPSPESRVPLLWIDELRAHLGAIAARLHGHPSDTLTMLGITGTNGKTSCVQMLTHALHLLGHASASIGTLGAGFDGDITAGERTTPDVISLHAQLATFRDAGASHVAMEVSSHALDQRRVDGVAFNVAAFTNLTRDHLDYHGTMQAYGEAKAKLFAWPGLDAAVFNIDDAFGRELATRFDARGACLRTSAHGDTEADVRAERVQTSAAGLAFHVITPWGEADIASPLLGRFNVANVLTVTACLGALGETFERIVEVLAKLEPVRGRMSRLGGQGGEPLLVVDYAHTPDALEQALTSLRAHCAGRLICVFGCGGERDAGKRPDMGAIAERLADVIIVTDDNPRGEDGDAIVAGIVAGLSTPDEAQVERDRARAIHMALAMAHGDDVILIAGKGHETCQEVAGKKHPFDDLAVARAAMEARPC